MIDSGSTTIEMARALTNLGTRCTVINNSIPVAMTIGQGPSQALLCPGGNLATEPTVIGTETLEILPRFNFDKCMIGSSGFSTEGPSETVLGITAVKRMMLMRVAKRRLLIESGRFDRKDLSQVENINGLDTIVAQKANDRIA